MLLVHFLYLEADFRLQLIDSAAKVECREYADLQLEPVSAEATSVSLYSEVTFFID